MKYELFDYQDVAASTITKQLAKAARHYADDNTERSAIVLAAPTGAGKTVIATSVIESALSNSDATEEAGPTFLWVTDDPSLNRQTQAKMLDSASDIQPSQLTIIDSDFDKEVFEPNQVYFLNIQKLGIKSTLSRSKVDNRTFSLWETIANTINRWSLSREKVNEYAKQGFLKYGEIQESKDQKAMVYYLQSGNVEAAQRGDILNKGTLNSPQWVHTKSKDMKPMTIWAKVSHDAGWHGSRLLDRFLPGRLFPFAKSLYAVEDALRFFVFNKPNALVLDFFAGSGTTAHAVSRLNHQDDGRRRTISVTNNEVSADEARSLAAQGFRPGDPEWESLGICEYITKPRIEAAVTGLTPGSDPIKGDYKFIDEFPMADGLEENVEFFTLTYEDPNLVSLGRNFTAIAPLIWLKAGAIGERVDQIDPKGWSLPATASYGILFDADAWPAFVQAANERTQSRGTLSDGQPESDYELPLTHVFIVTDSIVEYQAIVSKLDPALITTRLYADYLRTFEINTH